MNERFTMQGKRIDNGELVKGSLIHNAFVNADTKEPTMYIFSPSSESDYDCFEEMSEGLEYFGVDPDMVEPVAAKVVHEPPAVGDYKCPNCRAGFFENPKTRMPYCGNCGQRLDWSVAIDEKQ